MKILAFLIAVLLTVVGSAEAQCGNAFAGGVGGYTAGAGACLNGSCGNAFAGGVVSHSTGYVGFNGSVGVDPGAAAYQQQLLVQQQLAYQRAMFRQQYLAQQPALYNGGVNVNASFYSAGVSGYGGVSGIGGYGGGGFRGVSVAVRRGSFFPVRGGRVAVRIRH